MNSTSSSNNGNDNSSIKAVLQQSTSTLSTTTMLLRNQTNQILPSLKKMVQYLRNLYTSIDHLCLQGSPIRSIAMRNKFNFTIRILPNNLTSLIKYSTSYYNKLYLLV